MTRYRQRLGDKIAWTTVIDAESSVPLEALGDSAERPGGELESKEEEEP